jgi:hypothetical protein
MVSTGDIAKQIRFAARREGGEQRSWHQANEQRSRPINAVRRPDLFGYTPGNKFRLKESL